MQMVELFPPSFLFPLFAYFFRFYYYFILFLFIYIAKLCFVFKNKKKKKREKIKIFEVDELFLYISLNLFNLFFLIYINIK